MGPILLTKNVLNVVVLFSLISLYAVSKATSLTFALSNVN